jgi:demethylmenaquinone methyltransferase/2-methoxy-6-polyprenyl-1,4-benzoquinol methylase
MESLLPEKENKRDYVQSMFARIASRYDLMNRIMTFGQDAHWRELVIRKLCPHDKHMYIDVGAGTGDLSLEIIRKSPGSYVIAVDLTFQMLASGKILPEKSEISRVVADAQALPFAGGIFSGAVSGYLFRNVPDISCALSEQYRVIAVDASIVCLDTTPPDHNILYPFILIYLKWIIPLLGKIIVNDRQAYEYLPESTRRHVSTVEMAQKMTEVGFSNVNWKKLMFGTMAIHSAVKVTSQRL